MNNEETPKRKVPTVKEILAEQERLPVELAKANSAVNLPVPAEDMFSPHVCELTGDAFTFPGTLFDMQGIDGTYNTLSGDVEIPRGGLYKPSFKNTYWGFVKYTEDGPIYEMKCLAGGEDLPQRADLGDLDKTKWVKGKYSPEPEDPWKEHYACPLEAADKGGELLVFIARSPTTRRFMKIILNTYNTHPRKLRGLEPVIRLDIQIFKNSFNNDQPKPWWPFVDWLNPDGSSISAVQKRGEFGDTVPF
jgi:hypothetical protein